MQPSGNAQEPMEGMRLGGDASAKGLTASPFMGVTGSPALMPGAMDPDSWQQCTPWRYAHNAASRRRTDGSWLYTYKNSKER